MGRPGGAGALAETPTNNYLRVQDTGDPRDYRMRDNGSNRKIYFGHSITNEPGMDPAAADSVLDDGITISMRTRVATGVPLDDMHSDKGGGDGENKHITSPTPRPAGGQGYLGHDGGKGNFGVRRSAGDKIISFSVANVSKAVPPVVEETESMKYDPTKRFDDPALGGQAGLVMNSLVTGAGGDGNDFGDSYIAMGCGATGAMGAIDIDFLAYKPGLHDPVPEPATPALLGPGLGGLLIRRKR